MKCETQKTYHRGLPVKHAHRFYTSYKSKTVEFQQIILFFIGHKAKTSKTQTTKRRQKTQHEHNNPTGSVPSYWSTDP